VFSPYYAWSGRKDPENHVCINVALYGPSGARWAMSERGRARLVREPDLLCVGPSCVEWDGTTLTYQIEEVAAPIPMRVSGTVRVVPDFLPGRTYALDDAGRHVWTPIAPGARVAVDFRKPALRWTGTAYLDANYGSEPLESGFRSWDWARAVTPAGTTILYDTQPRSGASFSRLLSFGPDGSVKESPVPERIALDPTRIWRVPRNVRAASDSDARVLRTLEDSPFYARSLVSAPLLGRNVAAFHESLSLDRFATNWVKALLPFRMPRRP
jgi:carotenoid 1,2-hydratase